MVALWVWCGGGCSRPGEDICPLFWRMRLSSYDTRRGEKSWCFFLCSQFASELSRFGLSLMEQVSLRRNRVGG